MDQDYSLAFSNSNLGPKSFQKVLASFKNLESAWNGTREEYEKIGIGKLTYEKFDSFRKSFDIDKYLEKMEKANVRFVSFIDKVYPSELKKLDNPPIGLYVKGNVRLLKIKPAIGVVGTRKITSYGKEVTEQIVGGLVNEGFVIVSGLALGVDALSHRIAIENKGKTIAVLGCGVDCCNPSENYSLYSNVLKNNGLIVSEYALSTPPNQGTFPARNRIIAALSDGVLVTEAAEDSGSLITANWGFKLNKKVFAVPGPITSRMSDGSLQLLKQGAKLVSSAQDILENFQKTNSKIQIKSKFQGFKLSKEERKIVSFLENEALTIDEISKKTKIPVMKIMQMVGEMELRGIVKNERGKISI